MWVCGCGCGHGESNSCSKIYTLRARLYHFNFVQSVITVWSAKQIGGCGEVCRCGCVERCVWELGGVRCV